MVLWSEEQKRDRQRISHSPQCSQVCTLGYNKFLSMKPFSFPIEEALMPSLHKG